MYEGQLEQVRTAPAAVVLRCVLPPAECCAMHMQKGVPVGTLQCC